MRAVLHISEHLRSCLTFPGASSCIPHLTPVSVEPGMMTSSCPITSGLHGQYLDLLAYGHETNAAYSHWGFPLSSHSMRWWLLPSDESRHIVGQDVTDTRYELAATFHLTCRTLLHKQPQVSTIGVSGAHIPQTPSRDCQSRIQESTKSMMMIVDLSYSTSEIPSDDQLQLSVCDR